MNLNNNQSDPIKTILVIVIGFIVVFLMTKVEWILIISLIIGVLGLSSKYIARKIDFIWMKLSWILSFIVPNVLLSIIFYFVLTPIALLSRLFGEKNQLSLKNNKSSLFKETNKTFEKASFEKSW